MQVINKKTYERAEVVSETPSTYLVRVFSNKTTRWRKVNTQVDFDHRAAQLAIHLWCGYEKLQNRDLGSIEAVASFTKYIPALIAAERKLDLQLLNGRTDWHKVFDYDVAQAAGAWLADNPNAWLDAFAAHLEILIA